MTDIKKKITEANRIAWNEVMPRHQAVRKEYWDQKFTQKGFYLQTDPELFELLEIGIKNKSIVHLSCNNGVELLSLKNLGAFYCLGLDISDTAIQEANERAGKCGIDCSFLRSDVYEVPESYYNQFDLAYITIGTLTWLPDLQEYFRVVSNLVRKQGCIFIYEQHPLTYILADPEDINHKPTEIIRDYFDKEPTVYTESLDYLGETSYEASPHYEYMHSLSSIINNIIQAGFTIYKFLEYPKDISMGFKQIEDGYIHLPLSYILIAKK